MSVKTVYIEEIGTITLHKRANARSIRLSITQAGVSRVTLPSWVPYRAGIAFARSKAAWIAEQLPDQIVLTQGFTVGIAHHISFEAGTGSGVSTRLSGNQVRILLPTGVSWRSEAAQAAARTAAIRALKKEAKQILPSRLRLLADQHGYNFNSVSIKQLSGRWGSCTAQTDITLNCYLMKLPLNLIDYVLLHELAHTRVMAHGKLFWDEMSRYSPNLAHLRTEIKTHKPTL